MSVRVMHQGSRDITLVEQFRINDIRDSEIIEHFTECKVYILLITREKKCFT